jgi:uncharacterized protein
MVATWQVVNCIGVVVERLLFLYLWGLGPAVDHRKSDPIVLSTACTNQSLIWQDARLAGVGCHAGHGHLTSA